MARRITKAKINFLSLCERGANRLPVIYKAEGNVLDMELLVSKSEKFDENGELTAVVYAPEMQDSQGDIASAQVIKDALYDAARQGLNVDIKHDGKSLAKSDAFIAEQFIVQKNDPRFADMKNYEGDLVDVTGAWATVIKIESPELRKQYREGKWNGISMGGTAVVTQEKADDIATQVVNALTSKLKHTSTNKEDINMDAKELGNILNENNKALVEALTKAIKPADSEVKLDANGKPIVKAEDVAPKFEGEPTVENLRKHRFLVARYNVTKAIDFNKPESVAAAEVALTKIAADEAAAAKVEKKELTETDRLIAEKQAEIDALKKSSNQTTADTTPASGVDAEAVECAKVAAVIAKHANDQRTLKIAG